MARGSRLTSHDVETLPKLGFPNFLLDSDIPWVSCFTFILASWKLTAKIGQATNWNDRIPSIHFHGKFQPFAANGCKGSSISSSVFDGFLANSAARLISLRSVPDSFLSLGTSFVLEGSFDTFSTSIAFVSFESFESFGPFGACCSAFFDAFISDSLLLLLRNFSALERAVAGVPFVCYLNLELRGQRMQQKPASWQFLPHATSFHFGFWNQKNFQKKSDFHYYISGLFWCCFPYFRDFFVILYTGWVWAGGFSCSLWTVDGARSSHPQHKFPTIAPSSFLSTTPQKTQLIGTIGYRRRASVPWQNRKNPIDYCLDVN